MSTTTYSTRDVQTVSSRERQSALPPTPKTRARAPLSIRIPPLPQLQKPMPPLPHAQQTIRKVPASPNTKNSDATSTTTSSSSSSSGGSARSDPREGPIDITKLSTNPRITAALEPLLAQWRRTLSAREASVLARLPAEEAEAVFVVQLIESLEGEKRRRRAAESRVKMLEETETALRRRAFEVHEETQALLREMGEEGEWVCMRERELGGENEALKARVRALEVELWNARRRDGTML